MRASYGRRLFAGIRPGDRKAPNREGENVSHNDTVTELLDAVSRILLAAFCLGLLLLLLWFGVFLLFGDVVYAIHNAFFKVSRDRFDAIHYAGMALVKIVLFLLFLFPYLATRWVLKKRRG